MHKRVWCLTCILRLTQPNPLWMIGGERMTLLQFLHINSFLRPPQVFRKSFSLFKNQRSDVAYEFVLKSSLPPLTVWSGSSSASPPHFICTFLHNLFALHDDVNAHTDMQHTSEWLNPPSRRRSTGTCWQMRTFQRQTYCHPRVISQLNTQTEQWRCHYSGEQQLVVSNED